MPDTRETSVAKAAERAAGLGDYTTAERLLRELVLLQKMRLGPLHADLANTLNNLGVVCDFADKPADAEFFYRRGLNIAKVSLAPDHPFVATSEKNLRDFCVARGRPFESVRPLSLPAEQEDADIPLRDALPDATLTPPLTTLSSSRTRPANTWLVWFAVGLAIVVVVAIRAWSGATNRKAAPPADVRLQDPPAPPSAPEDPKPAAPAPAANPPAAAAKVDQPAASTSGVPDTRSQAEDRSSRTPGQASGLPAPTVASARICKTLSTDARAIDDWPCESPGAPARPGTLFFFTRVRSPRDTTVQHRWYQGNELLKAVDLDVRASPTEGYRTYSRNVVDARNGGEWRVELRTKDGALLHEERFSVQP